MPSEVKRRVLGDTWTNQQLRKTTNVLEVALGFMSSGAGSAKMALSSFVQDTLQMKLDSSIKVCNLLIICHQCLLLYAVLETETNISIMSIVIIEVYSHFFWYFISASRLFLGAYYFSLESPLCQALQNSDYCR